MQIMHVCTDKPFSAINSSVKLHICLRIANRSCISGVRFLTPSNAGSIFISFIIQSFVRFRIVFPLFDQPFVSSSFTISLYFLFCRSSQSSLGHCSIDVASFARSLCIAYSIQVFLFLPSFVSSITRSIKNAGTYH